MLHWLLALRSAGCGVQYHFGGSQLASERSLNSYLHCLLYTVYRKTSILSFKAPKLIKPVRDSGYVWLAVPSAVMVGVIPGVGHRHFPEYRCCFLERLCKDISRMSPKTKLSSSSSSKPESPEP